MPLRYYLNMKIRSILTILLGLLVSQSSQAAITLYIDDANERFWFDGSDTGSPFFLTKGLTWNEQTPTGDWEEGVGLGISGAFDVVGNTPSSFEINLERYSVTGNVLNIIVWFEDIGACTITADSSFIFNYSDFGADWSQDLRSGFVGYIGSSLPLVTGSGFHNISVANGAVPEPSTYASIAGLGALGLALLRRRNRSR